MNIKELLKAVWTVPFIPRESAAREAITRLAVLAGMPDISEGLKALPAQSKIVATVSGGGNPVLYINGVAQQGLIGLADRGVKCNIKVVQEGYVYTPLERNITPTGATTKVSFSGEKIVVPPPEPEPTTTKWSSLNSSRESYLTITDKHVVIDVPNAEVGDIILNGSAVLEIPTGSGHKLDIYKGSLQMRGHSVLRIIEPNAAIKPAVILHGIDESKVVGTTPETLMNFVETDRGIYLFDHSKFDIKGAETVHMLEAAGAVNTGANYIDVKGDVSKWRVGYEISVVPTEAKPYDEMTLPRAERQRWMRGFEERVITKIEGQRVYLDRPIQHPHPMVKEKTAEILNLTRNITIGGTETGRAHVFIVAHTKHTLDYCCIRHTGPRNTLEEREGAGKLGRYGLHWHHVGWDTKGTVVKGVLIRDNGNKCFVPHAAHGITFKDCVAYNYANVGFWWDPGHATHEITFDGTIAAKGEPRGAERISMGYELGMGWDNVCINTRAIGACTSKNGESINTDRHNFAYTWQANNEGIWKFENNIAHNNLNGLGSWQNTGNPHLIKNFTAYNNKTHIRNGAYSQSYSYKNIKCFGSGVIDMRATSKEKNVQFWQNVDIDVMGLEDYALWIFHAPLSSDEPIMCADWNMRGYRKKAIRHSNDQMKPVHFVECYNEGGPDRFIDFTDGNSDPKQNANPDVKVLLQMNGKAWQFQKFQPIKEIPLFSPQLGSGEGLMAEWYNGHTLEGTPNVVRVEQNMTTHESDIGIHHSVDFLKHSVRYTGKVQPFYSEEYTFLPFTSGTVKIILDGKVILDAQTNRPMADVPSLPVKLEADKLYDLVVEHKSSAKWPGFIMRWESKSQPRKSIQHSQLYLP